MTPMTDDAATNGLCVGTLQIESTSITSLPPRVRSVYITTQCLLLTCLTLVMCSISSRPATDCVQACRNEPISEFVSDFQHSNKKLILISLLLSKLKKFKFCQKFCQISGFCQFLPFVNEVLSKKNFSVTGTGSKKSCKDCLMLWLELLSGK